MLILTGFALARWIPWCKTTNPSCHMGAAEWAYWVAAVGTVGAFIGTICLATAESRRRKKHEMAIARISAATLHPQVINLAHICQNVCHSLRAARDGKLGAKPPPTLVEIGRGLNLLDLWTPQDVLPLIALPESCAEKLACVVGMIKATASLLINTAVNPESGMPYKRFVDASIHTLETCDKLLSAAAETMHRQTNRLADAG